MHIYLHLPDLLFINGVHNLVPVMNPPSLHDLEHNGMDE